MKYSSTTRLLNTIVFALLACAFGALGIYFGILYTPYLWLQSTTPVGDPTIGWGLGALLGIFGLTGFVISGYGLVCSVRSVMKGNDDALVRRSFGAYIAIGYTLAIFCLMNGVWLYRLTSSNFGFEDLAFVIVVYLVAFLICLVVSNIPLVRMYGESEELNKIMRVISGPLAAVGFAGTLAYGLSYVILAASGDIYGKGKASLELGVGALVFLVVCALAILAFIGYDRADKKGVISKFNGFLFEGGLFVLGGGIIGAGVIEYVFQHVNNADAVSLMAATVPSTNSEYLEFLIASSIVGGLIVLLSLGLCLSTLRGGKAKAKAE